VPYVYPPFLVSQSVDILNDKIDDILLGLASLGYVTLDKDRPASTNIDCNLSPNDTREVDQPLKTLLVSLEILIPLEIL
jgi:hypothetical protein